MQCARVYEVPFGCSRGFSAGTTEYSSCNLREFTKYREAVLCVVGLSYRETGRSAGGLLHDESSTIPRPVALRHEPTVVLEPRPGRHLLGDIGR